MEKSNRKRYIVGFLLVIVVIFGLGMKVGASQRPEIDKVTSVYGKEIPEETQISPETDFSTFWKVWNILNEKYPSTDEVSDQKRVYGAISGLVDSLEDPYSVFLEPAAAKSFQEDISGNFGGVGMEIDRKDGVLTVVSPLKDTPAFRAGIKAGDKILKINDTIASDMTVTEAVKLIRGEEGTAVTLTVLSEGENESREIKIVRAIISVPTLETELRTDGIFVIKLYSFSANSSKLFQEALKEFAVAGTDKLVLDLRGNPGGYLHMAVNVAGWFIPDGKVVVTEDYGDSREPVIFRSRGNKVTLKGVNVLNDKLKLVVLVDGGSASASEIVAGAIQDHKRGLLVGSQSFGKGSVQETMNITPDTILKITVAKWLTPDGNLIAGKGLTPDYKVEFTKADRDAKIDPQMNKAVELLKNWPGVK